MLPTAELSLYRGAVVVTVAGEIDTFTLPRFTAVVDRVPVHDTRPLVLDLRPVTFMDSSGLGALVGIRKRSLEDGRRLLVVCGDRLLRLFQLTGLDEVLALFPTVETAAASLTQSASEGQPSTS